MKEIHKTTKILSIINFLLILSILVVILFTPTANLYEISIYDAYPLYFWFLVILSLFIGVIILIKSYLDKEGHNNWLFGFLAILITNLILLSLPLSRNYFIFGRGDALTHIGYMKNILITGHVESNMYPVLHILGVETFIFSNINLNGIIVIFPLFFSIFYIVSFYLLLKKIFKDRRNVILGMIPASLLLFGTFNTLFSPNTESFLLIPFFLYCYFNSRRSDHKSKFALITVILSIFITLLHPLVCVILIAMLLIHEFSYYIYSNFYSETKSKIRGPYILVTIMATIFLMWQSYTYLLIKNLGSVFQWFIGGYGESQLQKYSSTLGYTQPDMVDLISSVLYNYGQWIVITVISLITILYLVKNRKNLSFINILSSVEFIFFIFWSLIMFLLIHLFGFMRIYIVAILISTFLFYTFLKWILSTKNKLLHKNSFKALVLCIIFIPILFFSTFNLYHSPYIKAPNEQVTASESLGMQTFFEVRNDSYRVLEVGLFHSRFFDSTYGTDAIDLTKYYNSNITRKNIRYRGTTPLEHFGYDNYTSMSDYYNKSSYLLVNDLAKQYYPNLITQYRDKWKFTPDDFAKLDEDKNLEKFFDNGNLNIYFIS